MRTILLACLAACAGAQQPTTGIRQDFDVPPEARSVVITSRPFSMNIVGADSATETAVPARSCVDLAPHSKHISFTTSVRWELHFTNTACADITEEDFKQTPSASDDHTRMLERMSATAASQGE